MSERPPRLAPPPEVVLLDEIASRLADLYDLIRETIPRGEIYYRTVEVRGSVLLDFITDRPYSPLYSLDIFNKGPEDVYIMINEKVPRIKLEADVGRSYNMGRKSIRCIVLESENATVEVSGVY